MSDPSSKKLIVVDPSVHQHEAQGAKRAIGDWPGPVTLRCPALDSSQYVDSSCPYDFDAVIILGSRASVLDSYAWLDELKAWLLPILRGEVRAALLGICFGHQLFAHLAGSDVGFVRPDRDKILGVRTTQVRGCRLLPDGQLKVVTSHCEEVKQTPAGFQRIAERADAAIDGLQHEHLPIYSFQFHPEAGNDFLRLRGLAQWEDDPEIERDSRLVLGAFRHAALSS